MVDEIVCYRGLWNGVVLDEFQSPSTGKTVMHVQFVKNVYKQQKYDVIEYKKGMFTPSTLEAMKQEAVVLEQWKNDGLDKLGLLT